MHAQLVFFSRMRRKAVEAERAAVFDKLDRRMRVRLTFYFKCRKNFSPRTMREETFSG